MSIEVIRRLTAFIILFLAQMLVLNHIHLFDIATPLLYVYFVITFRRNTPKWAMLLSSFALGLLVDITANTPGLAAGTMTLIALIQPYLLELLLPHDAAEDQKASAASMSPSNFSVLALILLFIYCLVFYAVEAFNFSNWLLWLERTVGSTALTLILIMTIETVRKK